MTWDPASSNRQAWRVWPLSSLATGGTSSCPAIRSRDPRDPTGAGDSFAGGFLGYLASEDVTLPKAGGPALDLHPSMASIRRALVHASVVASFAVEQFSVEALVELTPGQVQARFREFKRLTHFDE